jgi:signal transduction histidine kinase/dihydroneopterin aldolase
MSHEASTVTGVQSVDELRRELAEARHREAAATEVLRVIADTSDVLKAAGGRSSAGLQNVLNALTEAAVRLCGADKGLIRRRDGNRYVAVSTYGFSNEFGKWVEGSVLESSGDSIVGRATSARQTVHIPDVLAEPGWESGDWQRLADFRSAIAVPLVSGLDILGVLVVHRTEAIAFTDQQINLVETFADQAVIAIENTRLFEEVQARTRDLQETLDYQTATSDVLEIISRTPIDLQPVLAAICDTVAKLCETKDAEIFIRDGDRLRLGWVQGPIGTEAEYWPISRGLVMGRSVLNRELIQVHDLRAASEEYPEGYQSSLLVGHRTIITVPLMQKGEAVGVLTLRRSEVKPFTDKQIALLRTFADQAVIAIENARLFNDLAETVEQQSTTGEILRAIANSPGNAQAVLGSIAESAARLLGVPGAEIMRVDGQFLTLVTKHGLSLQWPIGTQRPISRDWVTGRAVVDRSTIHIGDLQTAHQDFPEGAAYAKQYGHRTTLATPLLREGVPIGAILIRRMEVRPFSDKQVKLLETFADQAVIAIENTRLFEEVQARTKELTESLEYQTATSQVLEVISRSPTQLQHVFQTIAQSAARLCNAQFCHVFRFDGELIHFAAVHGLSREGSEALRSIFPMPPGRATAAARAILSGAVEEIEDVTADPDYKHADIAKIITFRSIVAVPMIKDDRPIGAIAMARSHTGKFPEQQIELLRTFADQAVIAIENIRLFEEVQARTRELAKTVEDLEIASQHKSQFVANMSHELRTPLAAILGYAELMQEGFYEPLGQKSLDALTRIRSNGKHLLGLINTVLDIAKIESGQFTLNMSEYAIESVVETVRSATESLAQNKKLALKTEVAKSLPVGLGDEQRLTQVLLNLVGNAIKFTDTGEVRVTAKAVNGHLNISVVDTGPGIPEEHQARIFEQFHQVDSSNTKAKGGTGLGLAIAKQIVEMHGGRIWVESTVGKGSTFQMEIPARAEVVRSG